MDGLVHDSAERVLEFTKMAFDALDRGDNATASRLFQSRLANFPEYARLLAMRSGEIPLRGAGGEASGKRGVERLTDEIHAAYGSGNRARANRLLAQRDALAKQLWQD